MCVAEKVSVLWRLLEPLNVTVRGAIKHDISLLGTEHKTLRIKQNTTICRTVQEKD